MPVYNPIGSGGSGDVVTDVDGYMIPATGDGLPTKIVTEDIDIDGVPGRRYITMVKVGAEEIQTHVSDVPNP